MGNYFTTAEPEVQKPRQKIKWSLLFPRGNKEKSCRIEGLKLSVISSPFLPPPSRLSNSIICGVNGDSFGRENYIAVPRAVKSQDRKSQQDICGRGKTGLGEFFFLDLYPSPNVSNHASCFPGFSVLVRAQRYLRPARHLDHHPHHHGGLPHLHAQ